VTNIAALQPYQFSANEISKRVRSGDLKIRDLSEFYLTRTKQLASRLNSHIYHHIQPIELQIQALEKRLSDREHLPMAGVPVLIKDNICTHDMPTTCASKMLENFRPTYDAYVVERLRRAGAIIFGKTNLDEFAMGSSSENSSFGPTLNPWDLTRVPGGSSGGSAAAVAADLAPVALGSDTGGSIRQPASFCGVYGLKPTYGAVSRYGLVSYASSLDQIGSFARDVVDIALVHEVIAGHDPRDSTSRKNMASSIHNDLLNAKPDLKGLRIGLVRELFSSGLEETIDSATKVAAKILQSLGAEIYDVSIPSLKYSVSSYYLIATAEASANLARYDGIRYGHRTKEQVTSLKELYKKSRQEGFGQEVKQRIMLGTFALSSGYYDAYYGKASQARRLISSEFNKALEEVDILLSPVAPTTAFKLGEKTSDPLTMYLGDICTLGVNLAGLPALSVPCGWDKNNLPIGMQLIGRPLSEKQLLTTAKAYEYVVGSSLKRQPAL
jgi:aspartyl-tRNA(Asn)/glutamyl-tRNA(Gln) amidotransferase subunit A